jgi:hypothetical protein
LDRTSEEAARLISQFSLDPGRRNEDPFFRPLVKLSDDECLVAASFIETGRYSRNLFTTAIREGHMNFSSKGLKPLNRIYDKFLRAGFETIINFPILADDRIVTDVDIAATKGGFLFVGQTKVLIRPDTLYDEWKALENLRKAAVQLKATLQHLEALQNELGLVEGEFVVVPLLLTNIWDFTGATINGFKIIDFSYLSVLLTGGEIWEVQFEPVHTRQIRKLISGETPTGEELFRLLQRPIHEVMFEKPKIETRSFKLEEWTITVPVDTGKVPPPMREAFAE